MNIARRVSYTDEEEAGDDSRETKGKKTIGGRVAKAIARTLAVAFLARDVRPSLRVEATDRESQLGVVRESESITKDGQGTLSELKADRVEEKGD